MVKRRVFNEAFKEMARTGGPVELSYAKGSIQEAARELDIDPGRISKWRRSAARPVNRNLIFTLPQWPPKKSPLYCCKSNNIRYYRREDLPSYWQDETYERTQGWLKDWLAAPDQLGVAVPSVVVPLSYNIILHPAHALFEQIRVIGQEVQPVDRRLWRLLD